MTKYHLNHPGFGGPGIILKNAGQDATHGFKHAKHSPKAHGVRDALKIGEVVRNIKTELAAMHNLDDIKEKAKAVLTASAEAYYNAGAEDGTSMQEALDVWDRDWRLRPRNFVDVTTVDMTCKVLAGSKGEGILALPIMAAPTALLKMGHEDGEAAVARGCQMMGVGNCLSTTASLSIEDVAKASPKCYRWFQLYVYRDHNKTKSLVLRAADAGYSAIVLTVDLPVLGNRTSLKRIGFKVPEQFKMANMAAEKKTDADKLLETSKKVETGATSSEVDINKPGDRAACVLFFFEFVMSIFSLGV
jgi:isopentenyl diphosphate isomerase/L-lactate dehydrogenase-like FMN-dependent dehydrogenase